MQRGIITIPRFLMRVTSCAWQIDWRGQSAGAANDGSEQIVYNRVPRWVGSANLSLQADLARVWRSLIARGRGRVNCYSVPMIDPIARQSVSPAPDWRSALTLYLNGAYVEARPVIHCAVAAAAGASSITVDERGIGSPVRIGAILSVDSWPFVVVGRSGHGASAVLEIEMPLRRPVAVGAVIDLAARGLFVAAGDEMGWPSFEGSVFSAPSLSLSEWITR